MAMVEENLILSLLKKEFPKAPEQVLRQWLAPAVKKDGWPPTGLHWIGVLGKRDLDFWKKKEWSLKDVNLEEASWDYDTRYAAEKVLEGFVASQESEVLFSDSHEKQKVIRALKHLSVEGSFFEPITAFLVENESGGYSLVDGFHRLSAWQLQRKFGDTEPFMSYASREWGCAQGNMYSPVQKMWVARTPRE